MAQTLQEKKAVNFWKVHKTITSVNSILQLEACERFIDIFAKLDLNQGSTPQSALEKKVILTHALIEKRAELYGNI